VRSFAYATGPAYGLLLDRYRPNWRTDLQTGKTLPELLQSALKLPVAGELLFLPRFLRISRSCYPPSMRNLAVLSSISSPSWVGCSVLAAFVPSSRSRFSSNTNSS
jgi:hypothetical protein